MKQTTTLHRSVPCRADRDPDDPMPRINRLSPVELTREQVHVRSMLLCTDEVCPADLFRFSDTALAEIAERAVGVPVLSGHDRRSLPVARFFRAEVVELPESNATTQRPTRAVRAWFYWLAATSGAEDLKLNIDGGIYRAVSISWRYTGDRCSVCGQPACQHEPGKLYGGQLCHRVIDHVEEVLEGSLVYKGADKRAVLAGERHEKSLSITAKAVPNLDAAWLTHCARLWRDLPRRSLRCFVRGALAEETAHALANLGHVVRREPDGEPFDLLFDVQPQHVDEGTLNELASEGAWLLTGEGDAPHDQIPASATLARSDSHTLWGQSWYALELRREATS